MKFLARSHPADARGGEGWREKTVEVKILEMNDGMNSNEKTKIE